MFMRNNKGFTLVEVLVVLFLFSLVFLSAAKAISVLGNVTSMGISDMKYRRDLNRFATNMEHIVNSIISCHDNPFDSSLNNDGSGVVLNNILKTEIAPDDGKIYTTTDISLYLSDNIWNNEWHK